MALIFRVCRGCREGPGGCLGFAQAGRPKTRISGANEARLGLGAGGGGDGQGGAGRQRGGQRAACSSRMTAFAEAVSL